MQKIKMYVMCGIPGSGKSTWIREHLPNAAVISRDAIRFAIVKEDEEYFSHEKEVFNEFVNQIKYALKWEKEIVVDATHLNEGSRNKLFRAIGIDLKDVDINAIVLNTSLETALTRNDLRTGREFVPKEQIRRMFYQMTIPSFEEGFNKIYIVPENGPIIIKEKE